MSIRSSCPLCPLNLCFLVNFLFSWSIHSCEWSIEVSHYYCVTIMYYYYVSSSILVSICLTYCGAPMLGAYIFIIFYLLLGLIVWSLCSVLLCLFSQPLFESLFYLIWVLWLLLSFGLCSHEIFFFQPFTFSLYVSLVLRWVSCRKHI